MIVGYKCGLCHDQKHTCETAKNRGICPELKSEDTYMPRGIPNSKKKRSNKVPVREWREVKGPTLRLHSDGVVETVEPSLETLVRLEVKKALRERDEPNLYQGPIEPPRIAPPPVMSKEIDSPKTFLEGLNHSFGTILARIHESMLRMRSFNDLRLGTEPSQASPDGKRPEPHCMTAKINQAVDTGSMLLDQLEHEVQRAQQL